MTFPIKPVSRPHCLTGQENGKIDPDLLESIPGLDNGPDVRLVAPAARAWKAMTAHASRDGIILKATSTPDSYRPYAVQERIFRQRYTPTYIPGASHRTWRGMTWYQKPHTAAAAVPGTSNHGWGLAVDHVHSDKTVAWLLKNAGTYGWSWELQSEAWHLRYATGDAIPAAVLAANPDEEFTMDREAEARFDALDAKIDKLANAQAGYGTTADGKRDLSKRSLLGRLADHFQITR